MEDLSGRQFGQYRIIAPLGEGGMAAVYRAYQPGTDRYVALKVLPRHFSANPEFVARFEQEARIIAKLQHPHLLPVFDFGHAEGYTYIVMPLVQGGTLAGLLKGRPLPLAQIRSLLAQIGSALDYAHAQGIVHRDVKPSNVLIDESGNTLLTDFGIAKMVEGTGGLTATGGIIGTPEYMSPEQGLGKKVDARSDIYSLGIMLYQMATGRVPFQAETPMAVVIKHINDPLPLPRQLNPALPEAVERVILKALSKNPDDRFHSTRDMVAALDAAFSSAPPTIVEAPAPRKRSPIYLVIGGIAAAGLALFALMAVAGIILWNRIGKETTPPPQTTGPPPGPASTATLPLSLPTDVGPPGPATSTSLPLFTPTVLASPAPTEPPSLTSLGLIAFHTGPCPCQIYLVRPEGGPPWLLPDQPDSAYVPSFSPDGQKVSFESKVGSGFQVFTIGVDGRGLFQLTNTGRNFDSTWSPTGERILFTSTRDGNPELYVINPDGTGERRITYNDFYDDDASWAPDGKRVVFESERGGNFDLYMLEVDSGREYRLTTTPEYDSTPSWSPDGKWIAFEKDRDGKGDEYALFIMPAPGTDGSISATAPNRLTGWGKVRWRPAWSGDSRYIAFNSDQGGAPDLWILEPASGNSWQLTNQGVATAPVWARR